MERKKLFLRPVAFFNPRGGARSTFALFWRRQQFRFGNEPFFGAVSYSWPVFVQKRVFLALIGKGRAGEGGKGVLSSSIPFPVKKAAGDAS